MGVVVPGVVPGVVSGVVSEVPRRLVVGAKTACGSIYGFRLDVWKPVVSLFGGR